MNSKQKYCLEVCKSKCCKKLYLKDSPKELEKSYLDFLNKTIVNCNRTKYDIWLIYPMLQFLMKSGRGKKAKYYYRCKFLIKGKCSIYKYRPRMCKNFGVKYINTGNLKCIYGNKQTKRVAK